MIDVVGEPDGDAALGRGGERALDAVGDRAAEADVVERQVERPLGRGEERVELVRDVGRRLAAVGQRPELDQARLAFSEALYARLAAW